MKSSGNPNFRKIQLSLLALLLAVLACNFPGGGNVAEPTPGSNEGPGWIFEKPTVDAPVGNNPSNPTPTAEIINLPTPDDEGQPVLYTTQAGDTLRTVAIRFNVSPSEVTSTEPISDESLINPGQLLIIPDTLDITTPKTQLLPDSEVIYSPSAMDFDVSGFVSQAGGYLGRYTEFLGKSGNVSGAEIVRRVALDNSINPMLLLALIEYESGWVYGEPSSSNRINYPMGMLDNNRQGLYKQLNWAVGQLSIGYYGWREGRLTDIRLLDGNSYRIAPELNAGTVALQQIFSRIYPADDWLGVLNLEGGFVQVYNQMFGNPWLRSETVEPLYPPDLAQPDLILPFLRNQVWSFTGGPHAAWEQDGSWAALDFAPSSAAPGCLISYSYITASASGLVTRSERGVVVIDLDGDGYEQTGWALLYLHVAEQGRVPAETLLVQEDRIGFPSCEGGIATGTHVHIARKYNGEWISADGPLPFVLSGWQAHSDGSPYKGTLTRGEGLVSASDLGTAATRILRTDDDP